MDIPANSPDYYVDLDGEDNWDSADLNASDEPLYHTVLKTNFMELQEVCRRANVGALSSMVNVVHITLCLFSAPPARNVSSDDALRMIAGSSSYK